MNNENNTGHKGMIAWMQRYFASVPPIFLDGCIAVCIAVLTALNMSFATDDSAKYIDPTFRFWLLVSVGSAIQGMHALSKFRDKSYSSHLEERKNGNGHAAPKP